MIVGESSLLQLASKSSIHPVACMNLRTVPGAELLGVGSVGVAQDTFILRYAPPANFAEIGRLFGMKPAGCSGKSATL